MKRGRVIGSFALWAIVTGAVAVVPGCYGRNCDGSVDNFGDEPGEGRMIDENTWESAAIDGKWLFFPGARIYFFNVPALGDRKPYQITPYLSPVEDPNVFHPERAPANFANGGGNLTELSGVDRNRFVVRNGTCADYWLRVVVDLEPRPPEATLPPTDASVEASSDASTDATTDASTDAGTDAEAGP